MTRVCYNLSDDHPQHPHFHLAAIDNSLAFPHTHPLGWRSFHYGWLNLPLSLVGQPWSASTRTAFLPKLTDPEWWRDLRRELRNEFKQDKTFREDIWERQWAIVKGQGWSLVESLRSAEEGAFACGLALVAADVAHPAGPVELCRRPKLLVREDFALVAVDPGPSVPQPAVRRQDSAPLASSDLLSSAETTSSRPSLSTRRTAPPRGDSLIRLAPKALVPPPKTPPAPPPKTAPVRVARRHRRTQSDYGGADAPSSNFGPASAPAHGEHWFRRPLDSLVSLSFDSRGIGGAWTPESEEETGVGLMQRLDRVEADERKRLSKARRKDKAVRDILDAEERGEAPRRSWLGMSRSSSEAVTRAADEGGQPFHRSCSDEAGTSESTPLLSDRGESEERMTQSWYGGSGTSRRVLEDHDEVDEDEQEEAALQLPRQKVRRKWVIVEVRSSLFSRLDVTADMSGRTHSASKRSRSRSDGFTGRGGIPSPCNALPAILSSYIRVHCVCG